MGWQRTLSSKRFLCFSFAALFLILYLGYHSNNASRYPLHPLAPSIASSTGIPKKIWYKLGRYGLEEDFQNWTDTCITQNPDYHPTFLTDESADTWVRKHFASRPDIVSIYTGLSIPIVKADLIRYMLLYIEGGIWSDLDVECLGVPMDSWVPGEFTSKAGLVVGWEFDACYKSEEFCQFASWTIMAKPGSRHLLHTINDIVAETKDIMAFYEVPVSEITMDMILDIIKFSGPKKLTKSVYASLSKSMGSVVKPNTQQLVRPKLVGDVLILPGQSFSAWVHRYNPEFEKVLPPKLVRHHYASSWRNDFGGEV